MVYCLHFAETPDGSTGSLLSDSIRTTVARTLLSGAAQIIPSKTGDNEDEATGKSLLSPGAGKLGARRGSHLEPEIASHLENLRIRSPSPTSLNRKYVKLKNVSDGKTTMDTLYRQSVDVRPYVYVGSKYMDSRIEKWLSILSKLLALFCLA